MSKIGRRPIPLSSAKIEIDNGFVTIKGPKGEVEHQLPPFLAAQEQEGKLVVSMNKATRKNNMMWGLHRALLANKIKGVETGFSINMKIVGLGYKAQVSGQKMVLTLGYSHKINYDIPKGVTVEVDKTGQNLTAHSIDKMLVGQVCDEIRSFRLPEPYKGTGIIREGDVVIRKAGKTKAA